MCLLFLNISYSEVDRLCGLMSLYIFSLDLCVWVCVREREYSEPELSLMEVSNNMNEIK